MTRQASPKHDVDVAIVGAGVCGLAAAHLLHKAGRTVRVLEAASEAGGRIRSFHNSETGNVIGDRGPTWIWPEYQPVIGRWLDELDIDIFQQFDHGKSVVELDANQQPTATFLPAQHGSMRIAGGTARFIEQLVLALDEGALQANTKVCRIVADKHGITLHHLDGAVRASRAIIAVPPRIAVNSIDWNPKLPTDLTRALNDLPTWMAPHAKVVVVYKQPFWRAQGLSGRIASRVGPLAEVHDHCSEDERVSSLFGFVGWPYEARVRHRDQLPTLIEQQLVRCLGPEAATPEAILIEDWSENDLIARPEDLLGQQAHPEIGPEIVRQPVWHGRLVFAGAETALRSPGLIEGAFIAAEHVVGSLEASPNS